MLLIKDFILLRKNTENFKVAIFLIIATIPAAFFGYFLNDKLGSVFSNILFLGIGFFITSLFLFTASFVEKKGELNFKNSFFMGLAQALALFPGISRSGSTVSTGIFFGLSKDRAVRFSFLLSIPVIFGAFVMNLGKMDFSFNLILPFIIAFFSGLFAIHLFLTKIKLKNFRILAYYCFILALICIFYFQL